MKNTLPILLISLLLILAGCGPRNSTAVKKSTERGTAARVTSLVSPEGNLTITVGDDIPVKLTCPDTVKIDSVQFFLGGELVHTLVAGSAFPAGGPVEARIPTGNESTGKSAVRLRVFLEGGKAETQGSQVTFLSDIQPVRYGYTVVNAYPHDPGAYTQGLQYVDGMLYEGTGNRGESSLRLTRLETGEVVKIRDLDGDLFGEGITVLGERIYQLTYKSRVGFVYDKTTFQEIQKVYYQNREGWGLTHNGKELIMSDGSHVIYFLDPELFTVNRQIEVYHDRGPAQMLNELEYIDGKIWANRYYTDEIVIIDPATGKVEGQIDLKGILKTSDREPTTDVLNGIAWDEEGKRIFVTGKYWPKLFEIRTRRLGSG